MERFRDLVKETAPFNSIAFYVLTMHPRARDAIANEWAAARLPNIEPPIIWGAPPENEVKTQVLKGIPSESQAVKLFEVYLNSPSTEVEILLHRFIHLPEKQWQ